MIIKNWISFFLCIAVIMAAAFLVQPHLISFITFPIVVCGVFLIRAFAHWEGRSERR